MDMNTSGSTCSADLRSSASQTFNLNYPEDDGDPYVNTLWSIHEQLDTLRGHMSKQQVNIRAAEGPDVLSDELSDADITSLPPTYIVLRVAPDIPETTLHWIINKIKGKRRDGGAELIVMREPYDADEGFVLHISASKIKFLEIAEEMEIVKEDRNGQMRELIVSQLEEFILDGMHVDDLLNVAERETIVRHELENTRALAEDDHIPGYPTIALYEGQSILQVCLQYKIITKIYPLHDYETLKKLGKKWYLSLKEKQPIEEIRQYFGESIALYFTFLGFYTKSLLVPVFLGMLQLLISSETVPFFCIFNVVWVTVVLELWKRRSNELAFKWGTIGMTSLDEPRPNFRGVMAVDPITGRIQPQHPRYLTTIKMYCVSIPIVFLCMLGAFFMMLSSFWIEDYTKTLEPPYDAFLPVPSIIYSILVYVINVYYRKLATFLTEWENHRTQSQYDRHRVTKLVLFEFVNNFVALFYIAFVIRDMDMLRSQLQTMLIILQAINNFQEAVLPLAFKYYAVKMSQFKKTIFKTRESKYSKKKMFTDNEFDQYYMKGVPEFQEDDPRIQDVTREGQLEDYEGTYDDYLELFIQFGYVFLFSPVYPIAALWAFLNNVLEIRADAFKLCKIYQRPMSRKVKDIGAWQRAFEVLGALSILTNCGLLYLSPQVRDKMSEVGPVEMVLCFVLLEHILLGVRYLLHISISEKPEWVRVALAKRNYESKQALKSEKAQKNRRLLTRKFKTIHGPHGH